MRRSMSHGLFVGRTLTDLSVPVFDATAANAATLGSRVGRSHHSNFATTTRSGTPILVVLVAASALRRVAHRQWHARGVRRKKAPPSESMDRRAGTLTWNYRDRVEFGFPSTRIRGRRRLLQTEQLAQRPFHGH